MKNRTIDNIMAFFTGLLLFCCIFLGLEALAEEERATCKDIGRVAEQIMEARQMGVAMDKVVDIVGSHELMVVIVMDAYEQPRFSTEDYVTKAVADFKNRWLLNCYKARKRK